MAFMAFIAFMTFIGRAMVSKLRLEDELRTVFF